MLFFASHRFFSAALATGLFLLAGPVLAGTGPGSPPASTPRSAQALASTTLPAAASAAATEPGSPRLVQLKGVVVNPDGRPCAGASVFPAGAPRQLVVTDAQGNFVLPVPAGAALALQVEYFGVGSSRVVIDKPAPEPLRITLGQ